MSKVSAGKIDFIGKSRMFGFVSIVLVAISLVLLGTRGVNLGIDFAGGTEIQVKFKENVNQEDLRQLAASAGASGVMIQSFGDGHEMLLRFQAQKGKTDKETNEFSSRLINDIVSSLKSKYANQGVDIRRVDSVGPQIGEELKTNGILAGFYCLLLILIYVGLRFDYKFAPGAVLCLFHDSIITLGIFSILGKEVNVQIMAAILTIIGYSLNDTIVNYDRIRENLGVFRGTLLSVIVNRSINDVLGRTILTSLTTLLATVALYFIAGGVISDFAFTLGIGIIVGTYSSIYVAAPVMMLLDKFSSKKIAA